MESWLAWQEQQSHNGANAVLRSSNARIGQGAAGHVNAAYPPAGVFSIALLAARRIRDKPST